MHVDLTRPVRSFTRSELIKRLFWSVFFWPLVRYIPGSIGSRARVAMLRLWGAKIGPQCLISRGVDVLIPRNLILEGFIAIGRDVEIYNFGLVTVGPMTVISQYVYICTGTHDHRLPNFPLRWRDIKIGSECWVAADAFIGPGVTIGNATVIGARAVVTKDMPERMICAGNPCQAIKERIFKNE